MQSVVSSILEEHITTIHNPYFCNLIESTRCWNIGGQERDSLSCIKLAKVALEVPATQGTVVRLFSNMGFILSPPSFREYSTILSNCEI
jgi:hypothetical protein